MMMMILDSLFITLSRLADIFVNISYYLNNFSKSIEMLFSLVEIFILSPYFIWAVFDQINQ